MLDAARAYAGSFAREFVVWNGRRTAFQAAYFDFVLCSSVLGVTAEELVAPSVSEMARVCKAGGTLLLLEQVAERRAYSLDRYRVFLRSAGFAIARAYAIRPAASVFTSLVTRKGWIPVRLFGTLALLEIVTTANGVYAPKEPYVEYVIVARRL